MKNSRHQDIFSKVAREFEPTFGGATIAVVFAKGKLVMAFVKIGAFAASLLASGIASAQVARGHQDGNNYKDECAAGASPLCHLFVVLAAFKPFRSTLRDVRHDVKDEISSLFKIRFKCLQGVSIKGASGATGQSAALIKINIHRGLKKLAALIACDASTTATANL